MFDRIRATWGAVRRLHDELNTSDASPAQRATVDQFFRLQPVLVELLGDVRRRFDARSNGRAG
jgi:hypothetical protein